MKKCKENAFEILIISSILFIILFSLYRKITGNSNGTWSKSYNFQELENIYRDSIYQDTKLNETKNTKKNTSSKGETECRRVIESIFNKPFNKARPDFLRNMVTGGEYNLELDCYNNSLKIAVEYNGYHKIVIFVKITI